MALKDAPSFWEGTTRNIKRKTIATVGAAALGAALLSACGDSDSKSKTQPLPACKTIPNIVKISQTAPPSFGIPIARLFSQDLNIEAARQNLQLPKLQYYPGYWEGQETPAYDNENPRAGAAEVVLLVQKITNDQATAVLIEGKYSAGSGTFRTTPDGSLIQDSNKRIFWLNGPNSIGGRYSNFDGTSYSYNLHQCSMPQNP